MNESDAPAVHHVFANRSNIGDWLSAAGIQVAVGEVVEHLCDGPFVEQTLSQLAGLEARDRLIIGGGGLLMNYFEPLWRGLANRPPTCPVTLWGVGVCDTRGQATLPDRSLIRGVIQSFDRVIVRDEMTRDFVDVDAELVACPSLLAIPTVEPSRDGMPTVLHVDNYNTLGPERYEQMDAAIAAWAGSHGHAMQRTNNRIQPNQWSELQALLGRYQSATLVVSSGLHGCIIAVATGRPVVAVAGDRKVEGFMSLAGLSEWVLPPNEIDRLPALLDRVSEQPSRGEFVDHMRRENRAIGAAVRGA